MVGVSADKPETQRRFIDTFELTFPMIPDTSRTVIGAYGAKGVMGLVAQRSTFLVDPSGRIAHVWPKVSVEGHGDDVVGTLGELAEGR